MGGVGHCSRAWYGGILCVGGEPCGLTDADDWGGIALVAGLDVVGFDVEDDGGSGIVGFVWCSLLIRLSFSLVPVVVMRKWDY